MPGHVSHLLDEEHQGTLHLLTALERTLARMPGGDAGADPELVRLVAKLHDHVVHHVPRHFGFEERELFPRLTAAGDSDLCALLLEEHVAINAVIAEIAPLAARCSGLDGPSTAALKRGIVELAERLRGHIDKETVALLPLCDEHLGDDADAELALAYAEG